MRKAYYCNAHVHFTEKKIVYHGTHRCEVPRCRVVASFVVMVYP